MVIKGGKKRLARSCGVFKKEGFHRGGGVLDLGATEIQIEGVGISNGMRFNLSPLKELFQKS